MQVRLLIMTIVLTGSVFTTGFAADVLVTPSADSPDVANALQQVQQAQQTGNHARAIELLAPLHQAHPNQPDVPRLMAHSYLAQQQYDNARAAAVDAIAHGRLTVDLLAILMQVDRQRGDQTAQLNDVALLTVLDVDNATWRQLYGQLLNSSGQPAAAEAVFRRLTETSPADTRLWTQRANALLTLEQYSDAATAYETAWRLGDHSPMIATVLAGLYQRLNDTQAALNWLDRAMTAQSPPDPKLRLQQAQWLYTIGEPDAAATSAALVLTAGDKPLIARAHRLLGRLAMDQKRIDEALDHWHKALDAGSTDRAMLLAMGKLHDSRNEFDLAHRCLSRYIDTGPADREALLLHARAAMHTDHSNNPARIAEALQIYVERFGLDDDARTLLHTALTLSRQSPASPHTTN
ncbi:tetratricopeptide repeat protein [Planctomycetales bacterium ZRK34]|nr:tetratricopeptide repeat protein [Planctomycetales bacterium ZRK34]